MNVDITFKNNSLNEENSDIVIFQKNGIDNYGGLAVAWKVIKNCGRNWDNKFTFPMGFDIGVQDNWGNTLNLHKAANGQKWEVVNSPSGEILRLNAELSAEDTVLEIKNSLATKSIDAQIYKDGKLLATQTNVAPQEKRDFTIDTSIWIGVTSQIEEGQTIDSAVLSKINTKFNLFGITKADIVMTGGGKDSNAKPLQFDLIPKE